jgi:hypothetical protein
VTTEFQTISKTWQWSRVSHAANKSIPQKCPLKFGTIKMIGKLSEICFRGMLRAEIRTVWVKRKLRTSIMAKQ